MTNSAQHQSRSFNVRSLPATAALAMAIMFALTGVAPSAQAQTWTVLHNFTGGSDGGIPSAGLTMDKAGNFYGTTATGGDYHCGTVFKLSRKTGGWLFQPLYAFTGPDGCNPEARVIIGHDGTLFGTTNYGGSEQKGTVFHLQPPPGVCKSFVCPWKETVLHSFAGGSDGQWPIYSDLAIDAQGNIYGTTPNGGGASDCQGGCGVVFKLSASTGWTESILHTFQGNNDGLVPYSGVIFDAAGNLYGTTAIYGNTGEGTVYELSPAGGGWAESILYTFPNFNDGGIPYGTLIFDEAGNLYGTTSMDGLKDGGTAYELSPSGGGWNFSVLYSFTAYAGSTAGLTMDAAGNLYGTLAFADMEVFRLTPSGGGWTLTGFSGAAGDGPLGGVVLDASGNLYSTASGGGTYGYGVIFQITP